MGDTTEELILWQPCPSRFEFHCCNIKVTRAQSVAHTADGQSTSLLSLP